ADVTLYGRMFFFFQAEDGIRDWSVTGVQTCALPISEHRAEATSARSAGRAFPYPPRPCRDCLSNRSPDRGPSGTRRQSGRDGREIGRASCRERVEISVGAGSVKRKYGS